MWINIGFSNTERQSKRLYKGQSLIDFINNYTVIDVETTGCDPNEDRIIQISCIAVRNGQISEQFDTYVNPEKEINPFITNLTGITNEMAAAAPTISEVMPSVLDFIGDDIVVGHNVNFDVNFIYDAAMQTIGTGLTNNFIDTLRISKRLFPDWPDHRLSSLVTNFGLPADNFHNSLDDAIHTYCCYEYMKKLINENQIARHQISIVPKRVDPVNAKEIKSSCRYVDPDNPYCGKTFVFTGMLDRMDRKTAMQLVVDHGGICDNNVNAKTNYLVLGDYTKSWAVKDGKTTKLKKAESLVLSGQDLQIISEDVFFGMLEDYEALKS